MLFSFFILFFLSLVFRRDGCFWVTNPEISRLTFFILFFSETDMQSGSFHMRARAHTFTFYAGQETNHADTFLSQLGKKHFDVYSPNFVFGVTAVRTATAPAEVPAPRLGNSRTSHWFFSDGRHFSSSTTFIGTKHTDIYMYACMYVRLCVCICICKYIYIYAHTQGRWWTLCITCSRQTIDFFFLSLAEESCIQDGLKTDTQCWWEQCN